VTVVILRIGWVLAASALWAAWLFSWCAPAFAHAQLVEAEPSADEVLAESPDRVRLLFNEPVEAAFDPIEVRSRGGERVDEGDARVDPENAKAVVVGLAQGLPEGSYEVDWRVTSVDGHPIDGTYGFAVDAPADDAGAAAPANPAERPAPREGSGSALGYAPFAALGLGALVFVAFALLRRRGGTS
jgi:methionine-rich copper-binding protein CopC